MFQRCDVADTATLNHHNDDVDLFHHYDVVVFYSGW